MCDTKITKTSFCEDLEESVNLEVEVTPGELSEDFLEYVRSKQQKHEELFEKMRTEIETVNLNSDKEIVDITEILKEELRILDVYMTEFLLQQIDGIDEWNVVQEKIDKKEAQIIQILEEFSLDLTDMEKTRGENIKTILRKRKEEVIKTGFLGVEDIEEIFKNIVTDFNSKVLDNLRYYEDLKLRFRIDGDAITSKHQCCLYSRAEGLAAERAKELWQELKAQQVNRLVSEAISTVTTDNSKTYEDLDVAIKSLIESLSEFIGVLEFSERKDKNEDFWEKQAKELELKSEPVNMSFSNLEEILKLTITTVTETFDKEEMTLVQHLQEKFGNDFSIELDTLTTKREQELGTLQFWKASIDKLGKTLNRTKNFCLSIISFWQGNLKRINNVRMNLESNFESCYQKCQKKEQDLNLKIKNQVKAVREAQDKIKLDSSKKVLKETAMGLSITWYENFESNVETLEKAKNKDIPSLIKDTVNEANHLLLKKYPKQLWSSDNCSSEPKLEGSLAFEFNSRVDVIEKITYYLYEDLENYISVCEEAISVECESLFSDIMENVNETHNSKLAELSRKNQIFEEIIHMRLAELDIHCERLKSHTAGVNVVLNDLNNIYKDIKTDQEEKLRGFHDKLSDFLESRKIETWNEINSCISELEQEWNSLSIFLENRILDAKMVCQHKFETLKHSNDSFQKIAKLFKNGGNYTSDELKQSIRELKQLEKTCLSQNKTLTNKYNEMLKNISRQELDPIIKILQDRLNEVSLDDKSEEMLRVTRIKLRSEVDKMLTAERMFDSKIEYLDSLGKLDKYILDEIVASAHSIIEDLACILPLECEQKPRELSTPKSIPQSKKNLEYKKTNPPKNPVISKSLFENISNEELDKGIHFLNRIKSVLSDRFLTITLNIEDTLKPKPVETAKSKKKEAKHSAENEAVTRKTEQVRRVLQAYNKECELIWFNHCRKFIRQMAFLCTITRNLTEKILDETHSFYVGGLTSLEKEYKTKALKMSTEGTSEINNLRQTVLLPLAHPNYQHKLEDLYLETKTVTAFKKNAYNELVCSYQRDLQKKHDDYVEKISTLKESLENNQSAVFDSISCNGLIEKLKYLESIILDQLPEETEETDAPEVFSRDEIEQTDSFKYPLSIWADDEAGTPEHILLFPDLQPVEKISIVAIGTSKLKDSVERIRKLYEDAEDGAKEFEKDIAKCLRNLEYDINQAKLVYTRFLK